MRPTLCSDQHRSANSSLLVTTAPPSPALMFLLAWKLKHPRSPIAPTGWPFHCAPQAWQASSMTYRLCRRAMSMIPSMSAGHPATCTGMMALVRSVIAASTLAGSRK